MKFEKFYSFLALSLIAGVFFVFASIQNTGLHAPDEPAQVPAINTMTANKKLVFSDEFNGTTLDSTKWATCYDWRRTTETGCTNHGNFEQEWYTPSQVGIEDGYLSLTAIKKPVDVAVQNQVKTFQYQSGMVSTGRGDTAGQLRWTGQYGYYEARIKVQGGQGIWPAFWLLPADREWPPEIDVMEFIGSKSHEILQTVHWPSADGPKKSDEIIKSDMDYSSDWHIYAVGWREDAIDWYIDGKLTRSFKGANIPNKPMEIILNLAVGGTLPGNADETTPFPNAMLVDYVRVYQSGDQVRPKQQ